MEDRWLSVDEWVKSGGAREAGSPSRSGKKIDELSIK